MANEARPNALPGQLHDADLAALAAAGDRGAFGELARRHGSAVRALLRRLGAQSALADDLAQDAFLAAFEGIGEFRGEGAFAGWVKRIAARLYLKHWRRGHRLEVLGRDAPEPDPATDGELQAGRRLDLDAALERLSAPERLCVSLCYGAGLTHAEIAQTLDTPLGTVKSHVKRGLSKLKSRLDAPAAPDVADGRRTVG
jgi:RNA polymerase sigma-70 factor (ECF subfamily)